MKKNNVNEQRRDFLKKTSLGVAGSALYGGRCIKKCGGKRS